MYSLCTTIIENGVGCTPGQHHHHRWSRELRAVPAVPDAGPGGAVPPGWPMPISCTRRIGCSVKWPRNGCRPSVISRNWVPGSKSPCGIWRSGVLKNLLGAEQHGQIAGVGFDLYCQLLEKTINTLQNGGQPRRTGGTGSGDRNETGCLHPRWVHRQSPVQVGTVPSLRRYEI